ncbi:MAG: ADP-ribosylglycohydrolase family protein [Pseudomonadota bacterium]
MTTLLDRQRGCLLGLAIGDAMGMPAEFKERGEYEYIDGFRAGGPFNLNAGEWTDDTSMALCLADSIIAMGTVDPLDVHTRFLRWLETGENSHNGRCFDIGEITRNALLLNKNRVVFQFPEDTLHGAGNGSIMRLAPVAIYWANEPEIALEMAILQGKVTHGNAEAIACCAELCKNLVWLMNGNTYKGMFSYDLLGLPPSEIQSSGYCRDTLNAAQWAIANTNNFRDAILLAVNLGEDSDTAGAVTGQLAGALYGASNIPREWLDKLVWKNKIDELAISLS